MPYTKINVNDLDVIVENTQTTLRLFKNNERVFSCQVIAAGPKHARIINGNGTINPLVKRTIHSWLLQNNYEYVSYERGQNDQKTYHLVNR